jgi:hypothetical protein
MLLVLLAGMGFTCRILERFCSLSAAMSTVDSNPLCVTLHVTGLCIGSIAS